MVTSPVWIDTLANLGQYGVQCFFVISAITVAASIQHDAHRLGGIRKALLSFYVKRIARIAPLYYLAIIGYSAVEHVLRMAHGHIQEPHDFSDVILNLLFVHSWFPSATDSVVPGGWSIGVEMFFYTIAPVLVFVCRTTRGLIVVSLLTALSSAAFWYFGACDGGPACRIVNNEYFYFWPPTQLPCFIVGFWVWHLGKRYLIGDAMLSGRACAALAVGGSAMAAAMFFAGTGGGLAHVLAPTFAAMTTAALMLLMTRASQPFLRAPAVVALGRNSFGIYVWHFIAILGVRAAVRIDAVDAFAEDFPLLVFAASMVFVTAVAYAGARFTARRVEEPSGKWAKDWLAGDLLMGRGLRDGLMGREGRGG
jgi:peptidoglycan/LPS O-acetylase OafA/YrhL